jgi:hypothetical protein
VLPPRFAAALFRAVAHIPGTVLQRNAEDAAGAHGIGISRPTGGMRSELIFDPATYKLVGQEYIALAHHRGRPADYVTSATALIASKFVGTRPGTSRGGPSSASNTGPRNDQFIYTDTKIAVLTPVTSGTRRVPKFTLLRGSEQVWQSVDGSMPGAFDTAPCHAGRAGCLLLIPPGASAPALATYAELKRLPTSPGALATYLRHHNTCPATMPSGNRTIKVTAAAREWNTLTATLGNVQVIPPKLDKALFQAAASIAGTVVLRSVADAAGGHGIAVARNESAALRTELIFAPRSYRFIGVQDVLTKGLPGLRAGAVWAASSLVSASIVSGAPTAPLARSYTPQTCGYAPGMIAVSSSSSGTSVTPGSSSGNSTAPSARPVP